MIYDKVKKTIQVNRNDVQLFGKSIALRPQLAIKYKGYQVDSISVSLSPSMGCRYTDSELQKQLMQMVGHDKEKIALVQPSYTK